MMWLLAAPALALEGMWEPGQLPNVPGLAALGFSGDPAALGRLDAAPLAAVVSLGGCTASFVSADGLLVTNHHCVVGHLQQAQKPGEDLVASGFYAPTRADERMTGDHRVWITERTEDVTAGITTKLPEADTARFQAVEDRIKKLVSSCEKRQAARRCRVAAYDGGLRYELITQLELRDVRVVMAPPDSVGNYGDEIDNWHWPRHSGDFGFLRAYVGPDGKPADPSPKNVPYRPKHVLALDPTGAQPGEFVMVAGYPGRTERFWTSSRLVSEVERDMPKAIARREAWMALFADVVRDDPSQEAVVNVPRSYVSNGLFMRKGAMEGFAAGTVARAKARDAALAAWIEADPARVTRWKAAWAELEALQRSGDATWRRDEAFGELQNADLLSAADTILRFAIEGEKPDNKRRRGFQDRDRDRARGRLASMQASLSIEVERRFLRAMLTELAELPVDQQVPELMAWLGTDGPVAARVDAAITRLFTDPALDTTEERTRWLGAPLRDIEASKDGFLSLAVALRPYADARRAEAEARQGALARVEPRYVEAVRAFDPARAYPDANGTLRVTVGTIRGFDGRDGIRYLPQTRLAGVVEKAGPPPFHAPQALLDAIATGKHGPYQDAALGSVPVNFLTDLDTTGGNSGSATLDAQGRLVGLIFDGNYEGIASDWVYDEAHNRSIHADIRYVLYYLDAVANADALVRELGVEPAL
jgi:hypothetical protein